MGPLRAFTAAAPLLAVLLPLVTAAVAVTPPAVPQVNGYPSAPGNDRNLQFNEGSEQYVFEPLQRGSWTRDRKFLRQLQEPLCKPRTVLIPVSPQGAPEGATFSPDHVQVTRCVGACGSSLKACVATAVSTARVPVVLLVPDRNATAGHVLLQRHDKCACGCATQPHHCSERQEYIAAECRCGCDPSLLEEAQLCVAKQHFAWDESSCRCGCLHRPDACAHGNVWVPELCQCRPFVPPEPEIKQNTNEIARKST